ncbi:cell division protein FtsW [Ruminococcus sp. AF17-22AC]|uniref:FtsW/RodA/SpoVE family cell cycle protein n=1 Tax=Clostridia TaxID=186801 RepID=UPI000E4B3CEE|nr:MULTISPECIES: putative peptidoglycan glycosyltransferase FtsW [Clostridia]MCB6545595.1 putative lipid II flippase FtsW [Blautia glucerasea]RGU34127.1 cell division protein FtsW [Ruminococcus sp. AF17-22AC]
MSREKKAVKKPKTKKKTDYYDYSLLAVIILLTCFGLVMLYSTSSYMAELNYGDDMYYFKKQAAISFGCIIIALGISQIDYHILTKFTGVLYGMAAILMMLVKTPLGRTANGARRWLNLGPLSFQPSEVAKIAVIVCLSYMIVNMGRNIKTLKAFMILAGSGSALAFLAYACTDNLSTAIIIFCITMGLIFIAHPKVKPFLIAAGVGIVLIIIFVMILSSSLETSSSFRLRRILVWLHPEDFASGDGYQTIQALYAIGSGGFLGRGLGNSIQKLGSVPEAQNDMIFSIVCEELGILGGIILLLLFAYLLYRLFFIAQNAPDLFGSLMVSGIFIHIALQVIFNIAVVLNLMPNTGVTLPFVSYGGTSIVFLMSEMGLALSVARQIKFKEPERLL